MDSAFLCGQLLIAMPGIGDPRFEKALILVCAHDAGHAMGIAVNRPTDGLGVHDVLKQLDIAGAAEARPRAVLLGGPVETGRGFVLHTDDYRGEHSEAVPGGLALTTTRDVLAAMARDDGCPRGAILTLGYAGWGAGQLEGEIRENVWLTVEADEALVFDEAYETKWARALGKLGVDPGFLSSAAGRA
jgi:putative transcriptional regulator